MKSLWGGRFSDGPLEIVKQFTHSIDIDQKLWSQDIRGSIAHARMLGQCGIISSSDARSIVGALEKIHAELAEGRLTIDLTAEDIHTFVEGVLYCRIGDAAGRLHTARSRNDQVTTDLRLYLAEGIGRIQVALHDLQATIVQLAEKHRSDIVAGCTHLQHGQPISLAHYLLSFFWMLDRDDQRLASCIERVLTMPLGSGALAGTTLPIDRHQVANELGFTSLSDNSYDAVSDRDYVVEFLSAGALIMTHLSRLAEDLIIWSTPEFCYVEMHDSVTTGSSLMPQKKNPDVAELIRGKTGRLHADLIGALTLLKALPMSYNRDLQEDKRYLFDGLETVHASLAAMTVLLQHTRFNVDRMLSSMRGDGSNATDLADALVRAGVPFREAHHVAGEIVRTAIQQGRGIEDFTEEELLAFHQGFLNFQRQHLKHQTVAATRNSPGGTGEDAVSHQLKTAKERLQSTSTQGELQ